MKRWIGAAAGAVAGTVIALLVLTQFGGTPHEFVGTVLSSPEPAPEFSLVADTGERVELADFEDQVVLLYFGYTLCPDICPASLAELADAVSLLGEDRKHVQVAMISVDPVRDTPGALGEYVDHFDESFIGLTGTEAEIASVAESYNVFYEAAEGTAATGYLVDHWAGVVLIDRDGRLVELFSYDTPGEDIAADIEEWL
ncbi:MAG: SCO family protein [bacterium]|nr:SCO family protein [bacterium]